MKRFFTLIFFIISFVSNGQVSQEEESLAMLNEGNIKYDVKGGFGWKFNFEFDSSNVRIYENSSLNFPTVHIVDKQRNEVLHLGNDLRLHWKFKDSYFYYETIDRMVREQRSSSYRDTVKTITNEFKNILGYNCQKVILHLGEAVTQTFWITDRIKTGIIFPGSPLALESVALEMEEIDSRGDFLHYKAISIEGLENREGFEHAIPDRYKLNVPASLYSFNNSFSEREAPETYKSVEYPSYGSGAQVLKDYVFHELSKITGDSIFDGLTFHIWFKVDKDGKISNVHLFDFAYKDEYNSQIKKMLRKMPKWAPGKVRGIPVNSEVTIYI